MKSSGEVWIFLCLILPIAGKPSDDEKDGGGLYGAGDPGITVMTGLLFDTSVYEKDEIWLVEFYNRWCGHCIRYAPAWKEFAKDIQGWNGVVRVGAVDCSNSDNVNICRDKEINSYPTVKVFKSRSLSHDLGEVMKAESDVDKMRGNLIEYLLSVHEADWPEHFPKLHPLETMNEIWSHLPDDHKFAAFVFEESTSLLGVEVILDMSAHRNFVVRRMLKEDVTKYGVDQFPSVHLINRDGTFQQIAPKATTREEFVSALKKVAGSPDGPLDEHRGDNSDKLFFERAQKITHKKVHGIHMKDLESGLHYSLRQEIALHHSINGNAMDALKMYIQALAQYFPGRETVVRFLQRLNSWIQELQQVTGEDWVSKIDQLQTADAYLPEEVEWICCQGSEAKFRGYPCSLWSLFHTLTVHAHNYGPNNHEKDTDSKFVLLAMRGYLKHFFGCQECSQNFQKMAVHIEAEVENKENAVMWLWLAHNKANKRLHGDASEDPQHPKVQFPSLKDCPECQTQGGNPQNHSWNEDKVLNYLLSYYDKTSIVDDTSVWPLKYSGRDKTSVSSVGHQNSGNLKLDWWERQQRKTDLQKLADIRKKKQDKLQSLHPRSMDNKSRFQNFGSKLLVNGFKDRGSSLVGMGFGGFTGVDISLCLLLWLVSCSIVILLYFHIMVRRRRKSACQLLPF